MRAPPRPRLARKRSCDFLAARAAEDLVFRLSGVSRDFPRALDLGAPHPRHRRGSCRRRDVLSCARRRSPRLCGSTRRASAGRRGNPALRAAKLRSRRLRAEPAIRQRPARRAGANPPHPRAGRAFPRRRGRRPDPAELRACLAQAQEEIEGGASPRVAPFVDLRDLGALMQRAGLALPVADCRRLHRALSEHVRAAARPARHGRDQCPARRRPPAAAPRRAFRARPRSTGSNSPTPTARSARLSKSSGRRAGRRTKASRNRSPPARRRPGSATFSATRAVTLLGAFLGAVAPRPATRPGRRRPARSTRPATARRCAAKPRRSARHGRSAIACGNASIEAGLTKSPVQSLGPGQNFHSTPA